MFIEDEGTVFPAQFAGLVQSVLTFPDQVNAVKFTEDDAEELLLAGAGSGLLLVTEAVLVTVMIQLLLSVPLI